jgi:hypothetical protein
MKKLLLAAAALFICGCAVENSSDVSQDRIRTSYGAVYSAETKDITFSATFTFGTTYLQLDGDSSVAVDGLSMQAKRTIINSLYYQRVLPADTESGYEKTYVLSYVNNDGQTYENSLTLPPELLLEPVPATVPVSQPLVVQWTTGEPVQNMRVAAWLRYADDDSIKAFSVGSTVENASSGSLTFSADKLAAIYPHAPTLEVCVIDERDDPVAPEAGGSISISSCTAPVVLTLEQ